MVVMDRVVADDVGLSWHVSWRRYYARWEDVTAYYDQRKPQTSRGSRFPTAETWQRVVKTKAGTLIFNEDRWPNDRQMRDWIREHATSATFRCWGEMRTAPEDWPLLFHYDTAMNRNSLRWLHQWHLIGIAAFVAYFFWVWQTTHAWLPWTWLLTPTGLFFVLKQGALLALYPSSRRTEPYLKRKIRADAAGLTFIDGDTREQIAWGDIEDFYVEGMRCVVVSPNGEQDFLEATLTGDINLRKVIARYAVNAKQTQWRKVKTQKAAPSATWYSK